MNIKFLTVSLCFSVSIGLNACNTTKEQHYEGYIDANLTYLSSDYPGRLSHLNINRGSEVALEEIKIAKSGHLPSLNLKAGCQYQDSAGIVATNASSQQLQQATTTPGSPLSSYGVANVGIQLNVPLYSGGGVSAQVRQAQDYYKASKFQQVDVERQIEQVITSQQSWEPDGWKQPL